MSRRFSLPALAIAMLLVLLLGASLLLRWVTSARTARRPDAAQVAAPEVASARPPTAAHDTDPDPFAAPHPNSAREEAPSDDPLATTEYPQGDWDGVDMDAIRAALPDNVYWKLAAPTKDPEVLRQREEERARWNAEYGKVLSNTATAEEVDAYYAERQRVSEDYLEFVVYLLTNYGYEIPARDVALLKLAAEMHHERLEEIPRRIAEAHQRREAHEAARQKWREEQKAFEADAPADPDVP